MSNTKGEAERLAQQILTRDGYEVELSHPEGGLDRGADGIVYKRDEPGAPRGVMAVYFSAEQQTWATIRKKLKDDAAGVAKNSADYLVFVINQKISLAERDRAHRRLHPRRLHPRSTPWWWLCSASAGAIP